MADILNFGLEAAAGGVFGLVGTALGRVAGFFERGQKFKQEQARWSHEEKLHELNMQARAQETEAEILLSREAGSWDGLDASIRAEAAIGQTSAWVNNTLRLVRPSLTFLLWLITLGIFLKTQNQAIAEAAVFAATAATLWWFGDRAPEYAKKFNGGKDA